MTFFAVRTRMRTESGFSLVELIVTCVILSIVLGGLANIFVSGLRASSDGQARLTSQQSLTTALGRLEYDARCASAAGLLNKSGSNGAGVHLTLPAQCSHSTGDVTWCVSSGNLMRVAATSCLASGTTFASGVTTATPFTCNTVASGTYPQLVVALTVNVGGSSDSSSVTDSITMRNNSPASCS